MATTFNYGQYLASREWALLKEQVQRRSGGLCERCRKAPHQDTHHLTYERIGRERVEDLQGVCRPCHEFLSAKSGYDPAAKPKPIVYLAGKIAKNDWRHDLFPGLRGAVLSGDLEYRYSHAHDGPSYSVIHTAERPESRDAIYGGPFFVGCDHGGFHGDGTHGQGTGETVHCCAMDGTRREDVVRQCLSQIDRADVVFCWLDRLDAYGTLFELGYARAIGVPVWIAYPFDGNQSDEAWFAVMACGSRFAASDHREAWNGFVSFCLPDIRVSAR